MRNFRQILHGIFSEHRKDGSELFAIDFDSTVEDIQDLELELSHDCIRRKKTSKETDHDPLVNIINMLPYMDKEQKIVIERVLQSMLVDTVRKLQQEKQLHSTAN